MITLTAKKTDTNTLTIRVDQTRIATGHRAHRGGAGTHQNRRNKRHNTRGAQLRRALKD